MCIIIDTNTFHCVFNSATQCYSEFEPVKEWITTGAGKMVLGGTKYLRELGSGKYRSIVVELSRKGRVIELDKSDVDKIEAELIAKIADKGCDDHHLIAIVINSGCRIIATNDGNAEAFLTDSRNYPKNIKRPRIYKRKKQARHLLTGQFIAGICK